MSVGFQLGMVGCVFEEFWGWRVVVMVFLFVGVFGQFGKVGVEEGDVFVLELDFFWSDFF